VIDSVRRLRGRLAKLPDLVTTHTAYLDEAEGRQSRYYRVMCSLEKRGEHLTLDFSASSPQAGAVINCTESGLRSGALIAVLVSLAQEEDWCPAAVEQVVDVVGAPGTVVDAEWPAGCSMATMAGGFATTTAAAVCFAKLLGESDEMRDQAMAAWMGATGAIDIFGTDQTGSGFGTVLLDSMAGGTGARSWADGIDTGGFLRSMACVISNVEQYEARYPVLYLYRRQEPDTGGAGARRGGTGIGYAIAPHKTPRLDRVNPHFSGSDAPESVGLAGGYPAGANRVTLIRNAPLQDGRRSGRLPHGAEELSGRRRSLPGVAVLSLEASDILSVSASGGGGWGDPLDRAPAEVADDVRRRLVSGRWARRIYGVVIGADGQPDEARTAKRRTYIREARQRLTASASRSASDTGQPRAATYCRHCNRGVVATSVRRSLAEIGPRAGRPRTFDLQEDYCPICWGLLNTDRVPTDEAIIRG
jgi:N-methylhydantoinase B